MSARYSRQTGYTVSKRQPARPSVRTVQRRVKLGPTTAKFLGLTVVAILAVVMLSQSGNSATSAYQQNQLRGNIAQKDQETQNLELEAKRSQSLQEIQKTPAKDTMQPVQRVDYVEKGQVAGVSTEQP